MSQDDSFPDFIKRIRGGDPEAAVELVRRFEPFIRREARMRLRNPRLTRLFDSVDVCQSVLASFFVRAALGDFDLEKPANLVKLLAGMVCKKVAFQVRKQQALKRDMRQMVELPGEALDAIAAGASPSRVAAGKELLREFRERLTDEERQLADLRAEGHAWEEIAAQLGGNAKARCKQLGRAMQRISQQLKLDEADDV
ncbi:MAG: sigma-70 family RNA polymerase sigma factor [Planctomycetes bacterium]|nr:sigma-70 family RNA polymerase sigma factor [Planctomycetota bacterium]